MTDLVNNKEAAGEEPRLRGEDEAGPASNQRDLAGLLIAAALFALAWIIFSDASGYPVRRSYAGFGPEIVPYIVGGGIVLLASLTLIMAWRGGFEVRPLLNTPGLLLVIAGIVAQIALLYAGAGFVLASTALFGLTAFGFGQKTLVLNFAIGAGMSILLFILFRYGLGLALPAGPLENSLNLLIR
ncbi:tripartite tricarboxylate transporter TctB family protein (plasmid) [Peteryoungia desertarenae]|uniref:Tripartite tricarboxylate transporter TctB family protein n=1 Tax=Peteryoungia desertarenae TaxID=1813451 RepID=A0ABX6QS48_9HYPH|nr:tripartite tricarboxylate transporter TctB family protein [Peteryoungia desertarenae]QLF71486.1 tripartite tricarboxylate transporter TctB family protein [Peteryoungia desertarenae]